MIVLRLAHGIRSHFPARVSEWALAAALTTWGYILLLPQDTFAISPAYRHMAAMASETKWGSAAVTIGGVRLLALIINGTFAETPYGKISPHVRGLTAFFSCFAWVQILIGLLGSGDAVPGIGIVFWVLVLDIYNTVRAFGDAGDVDRVRKNGG